MQAGRDRGDQASVHLARPAFELLAKTSGASSRWRMESVLAGARPALELPFSRARRACRYRGEGDRPGEPSAPCAHAERDRRASPSPRPGDAGPRLGEIGRGWRAPGRSGPRPGQVVRIDHSTAVRPQPRCPRVAHAAVISSRHSAPGKGAAARAPAPVPPTFDKVAAFRTAPALHLGPIRARSGSCRGPEKTSPLGGRIGRWRAAAPEEATPAWCAQGVFAVAARRS